MFAVFFTPMWMQNRTDSESEVDRWLLMQRLHNDKHNADMLCTEGSGAREQLVASHGQEKVRGCLSPTRTATKRARRVFKVSSDSMEEKLVQAFCEKKHPKNKQHHLQTLETMFHV